MTEPRQSEPREWNGRNTKPSPLRPPEWDTRNTEPSPPRHIPGAAA
jgi:hypothetical protein